MTHQMQCYVHNGPKTETPCLDGYCVQLREDYERKRDDWEAAPPLFASVPGGSTRNVDYYRDSAFGMEEYREAKATGTQTGSIRKGATHKYEQKRESQQRAIDKLSTGMDVSELQTVPGVEKP